VVRLPPSVHGEGDHGFVPRLIDIPGQGGFDIPGRWVQPLARRAPARRRASVPAGSGGGSCGRATARVGEEGVPIRDIAEVIGRHVQLPATAISTEEEAGLASRAARTHPGPRRRPLRQGLVGLEPDFTDLGAWRSSTPRRYGPAARTASDHDFTALRSGTIPFLSRAGNSDLWAMTGGGPAYGGRSHPVCQ
jgi:hypothetical protein